jgi:hypothetical protein
MLRKILFVLAACLLLLTMPVLAAEDDQSDNSNSQAAYGQSDECQGGVCSWRK